MLDINLSVHENMKQYTYPNCLRMLKIYLRVALTETET